MILPTLKSNGKSKLRDRVAWRISTWAFNTFASKEYHAFIYVLYKFGREELERRLAEDAQGNEGENEC